MKTFKEFCVDANIQENWVQDTIRGVTNRLGLTKPTQTKPPEFPKSLIHSPVPSELPVRPSRLTSIKRLASRSTSDMARSRGDTSGVLITPLNQVTYQDRVEAGRSPGNVQDNPDFQGPVIKNFGTPQELNAGRGTKDRMPGTTPSSNPKLPPPGTKRISPSPIKPKGTGSWV